VLGGLCFLVGALAGLAGDAEPEVRTRLAPATGE
jgi:hypothetical protein